MATKVTGIWPFLFVGSTGRCKTFVSDIGRFKHLLGALAD